MSILNSVMNVFKLTGEDDYDEYDDYDEEFEDDEDDKGSARKKLFSGSHKNKDDEDYDSDSRTNDKKPLGRKVVPLKTGGSRGLEVVVIRPELSIIQPVHAMQCVAICKRLLTTYSL